MRLRVMISEDEEGGYVAYCPALGCHSQGETMEEVLAGIREAIECHFESMELDTPSSGRVVEIEV